MIVHDYPKNPPINRMTIASLPSKKKQKLLAIRMRLPGLKQIQWGLRSCTNKKVIASDPRHLHQWKPPMTKNHIKIFPSNSPDIQSWKRSLNVSRGPFPLPFRLSGSGLAGLSALLGLRLRLRCSLLRLSSLCLRGLSLLFAPWDLFNHGMTSAGLQNLNGNCSCSWYSSHYHGKTCESVIIIQGRDGK